MVSSYQPWPPTSPVPPPVWEEMKKALETMHAVVEEFGEDYLYERPQLQRDQPYPHPYPSCLYVHYNDKTGKGQPGCIVAHVLHRMGMTIEALARYEHSACTTMIGGPEVGVPVEYDTTLDLLRKAQRVQDLGEPWGRALYEAKSFFANFHVSRMYPPKGTES